MTELEVFQKSLEVSRTTLVVSVLLSVASMVFAILGMAFQRSHNKRSLRPLCDLRLEASGQVFRLGLRNAGLGPMILGAVSLAPREGSAPERLEDLLRGALPLAERRRYRGLPRPGLVLGPGESLALVELPLEDAAGVGRLTKALEAASIEVDYTDIYGRSYRKILSL